MNEEIDDPTGVDPEFVCPECHRGIYYYDNPSHIIDFANWSCCSDCAEKYNNS